ncbi:BaiN/RdsA family NAD(P)/FAD-dependent oxidoreductase [Polluticaenibacter yanchengensis]|uniref:NAD(P)/FAD-dependent oxidoreductase n=1 Tax=Polluticaenibacter yanchengensis TaxID=3014562 RepID=A0ABT4UIX0_9BACT|nr:NAD(P)/FAD-dependent oxidoreductase [Chitinophagaceae bacterium LY-5]
MSEQVFVIGGGAAGFFCAINIKLLDPSKTVTIYEKTNKTLQKVKISGGGRCNVTHACFSISDMIKNYPRGDKFLKKAFHHFFTTDTVAWFKHQGVELVSENDGRMFPVTNSSQTIIDCLIGLADKLGVKIVMNTIVQSFKKIDNVWEVQLYDTTGRETYSKTTEALCISCGGFPKIEQFDWIEKSTGHTIIPPIPSLFTFNLPDHPIKNLMGVAVPHVKVKIEGLKAVTEGPLLITHWGVSGPAILKMSAIAARDLHQQNYHFNATINWLPAFNEESLRTHILEYRQQKGTQKVVNAHFINLPARLMSFLLLYSGIDEDQKWATLPAAQQNLLIKNLCSFRIEAKGKTTFKEEFVTAGGIDLKEVDSATMESKLVKGLYFAGEILDIDGVTGGFNFQNAWTTGYIAAKGIIGGEK